jgi:hydroxyethylthiazole kinase-like uncharacterized protein yjeF
MDSEMIKKLINRSANSNKYDFGHVLVVGGSPGMVGAPYLSAQAALRIGAGLVSIASSSEVIGKLEERTLEIMTHTIEGKAQGARKNLSQYIKDRKISVVAFGPGINEQAAPFLFELIENSQLPMIIDGGGLGVLKDNLDQLGKNLKRNHNIILTPHMGEFARFFDEPLPKDLEALIELAKTFCIKHQLNLVLKGNPTHVISHDQQIYTNKSGGPALATAGSGDVLSGMIAGLIAQKLDQFEAIKLAVYLHGVAGELAAQEKTEAGVIASDVIESIPKALKAQV